MAKTLNSRDVVIGVMGMTGAGKSTFIKSLTNDEAIKVGDDLDSCTQEIAVSSRPLQGDIQLHLVDTPGFDDSSRDDAQILGEIGKWLATGEKRNLNGLIYIHQITEPRIRGGAARNLEMMNALVGKENMGNVILLTNKWECVTHLEAEKKKAESREKQFCEGKWGAIVQAGAILARHNNDPANAEAIIQKMLKYPTVQLQIQQELENGKTISETTAGETLFNQLEKQISKLEEKLSEVQQQLADTQAAQESLTKEQTELKSQLSRKRMSRKNLHAGLIEGFAGVEAKIEHAKSKCIVM